jgi:hypothetical protein
MPSLISRPDASGAGDCQGAHCVGHRTGPAPDGWQNVAAGCLVSNEASGLALSLTWVNAQGSYLVYSLK